MPEAQGSTRWSPRSATRSATRPTARSTTRSTTRSTDGSDGIPESLRQSQERTIGQLVAQAVEDVRVIVQKEIQLAKTELTSGFSIAGKGAGLLAGGGVLALYGLGILLIALSLVIAIWLPAWAGFLIVAVVLFLGAGLLALLGRRALTQAKLRPERALASSQATLAAVQSSVRTGAEHAKAVPAANAQVAVDQRPAAS